MIEPGEHTLEGWLIWSGNPRPVPRAALDSTTPAPRVTSPHVHGKPENHPSGRASGDEAAGHGEHEGHHR